MPKCRPHTWNIEDWLPLYASAKKPPHSEIKCTVCGRVLALRDMSPNIKASIANGIARHLYEGDEYDEVYDAACEETCVMARNDATGFGEQIDAELKECNAALVRA